MWSFNFFNLLNPSSCIKALGFTQPLTEMSTISSLAGKVWAALDADNLIAICELTV
jgi:hypothetical protein